MEDTSQAVPGARGKVCCVANLKGGVGKTTTAIMAAEGLSAQGLSVLVIDTDAQANFGWSFLGDDGLARAREEGRTVDAFVSDRFLRGSRVTIEDCIHEGVSTLYVMGRKTNGHANISLMPCTPRIIDLERRMLIELGKAGCAYPDAEAMVYKAFASVIDYARSRFDWVVVDCAPGLNILTRSALGTADTIVVATVPEPLPVYGLETFLDVVWASHDPASGFPRPVPPNVLVTRFDSSQPEHRKQEEHIRRRRTDGPAYMVMRTVVPEMSYLKSQTFWGRTRRTFAEKYAGGTAKVAMRLAAEIQESVHDRAA